VAFGASLSIEVDTVRFVMLNFPFSEDTSKNPGLGAV
jgi:hypothetical protein